MSGKKMLRRMAAGLLTGSVMVGLLAGCAANRNNDANPFFDEWRTKAEKSKGYSPERSDKNRALAEQAQAVVSKRPVKAQTIRPLPTRKVTAKLQDIDVGVALRAIAKSVGQNILINEKVKGVISLDVKAVPWDQVFMSILRMQGLSYAWEGDILRIMTYEDRQRDMQRDLQTRVIAIEYADAVKLKDNVQNILDITSAKANPAPEGGGDAKAAASQTAQSGSVMVDEHSNSLIIQATAEEINRILPLIASLDRPTPQVHIEAHIVEATKDTARELGIQWGGLAHGTESGQYLYSGSNSSGIFGQTLTEGVNPTIGQGINFPANLGTAGMGLTLGYLAQTAGETVLSVQLSALQEDGKLNILSSPSITTLDNQVAMIESGAEVPFQTVDENGNLVIEWKKATLKLEVTPHVIEGDTLKLKIITKKDELDFTRPVQGNPTIITKNAETNVVLLDGQTTVIGGLNKETTNNAESGVPGLKDIPVLGWLFKGRSDSSNMEEVLIFITPYILKERTAVSSQGTVTPEDGSASPEQTGQAGEISDLAQNDELPEDTQSR